MPTGSRELADDIKTNGQVLPIVLLQGRILDGRSRYIACRMAGREPIVEEFNASETNRTPSQRAALAAAGAAAGEASAPLSHRVAKQVATTLGVSERKVYDANRLRNEDPAGFEEVKKGKKTLGQATNRKSRAKRGVDPEKLEAIARAIEMGADMAWRIPDLADRTSLFDGVSISAGDIHDLADKSPEQIRRIYRLLRAGISYSSATKVPTGPGPHLYLSHTLKQLSEEWMAQYGNGTITGALSIDMDTWRVTIEAIPAHLLAHAR